MQREAVPASSAAEAWAPDDGVEERSDQFRPMRPAPELLEAARRHRPRTYEGMLKPAMDRAGAAFLLVLFSPLLMLTALLVLVSMGPPVVIRQERVGRHGQLFKVCKFRTMAQDQRREALPYVGPERRIAHKRDDDPRHTVVGRFLRKWSLDELLQLWNVLAGEMSMIGPRPELVSVVTNKYEDWQHLRHKVKPGITGLWQVREHRDGNMWRHTDIDLLYVTRLSWEQDLHILLATPGAVLWKRKGS